MESADLINIWKSQNAKIDKTLAINQLLLRELTNTKAKSTLNGLIRLKTMGVIAFVFYLLLLGYLLVYAFANYTSALNYFIVSISAIAIINVKGFADYIKHLYWTTNFNYNGSIIEIQQQLSRLQLSIIKHSRTMCLQFPFFTTFYLSNTWFPQEVVFWYVLIQITVTISFVYLSFWLYKIHKPESLNKKWFRNMIAGSGGRSVEKAFDFYKEMELFEIDN